MSQQSQMTTSIPNKYDIKRLSDALLHNASALRRTALFLRRVNWNTDADEFEATAARCVALSVAANRKATPCAKT